MRGHRRFRGAGLRRRVELRKMMNLRTNVVETTAAILAHPERCKQHFTDARWESFKADLRYFRTLENPRRWTTPDRSRI